MSYKISLTYKDDKTVNLLMPEELIEEFFADLTAGKVHMNPDTKVGFWTSFEQLKHIIVQPCIDQEFVATDEDKKAEEDKKEEEKPEPEDDLKNKEKLPD